jgi:NAD(P) transhydrogenase
MDLAHRLRGALTQRGVEYIVGRGSHYASPRGRIIGDSEGFLKLIFKKGDMKLLGVHAIVEQATDLIHIGLIALPTIALHRRQ